MENFIRNNYPKAIPGLELTKQCTDELFNDHGFKPESTVLATSVCSDEIIRSATNFRDYLDINSPFQLGGLAGFPFTGVTGLKAFAAHIPDEGAAIILYGPHIGISAKGEVGIMKRHGQILESTCCGALVASLGSLEMGPSPEADSEYDYQLWKIESELHPHRDKILGKPIPLVNATEVMYERIDNRIHDLLNKASDSLKGRKIALVGGVIINTDTDLPDWFDLKNFEVLEF
jgi:hypothetical protein